MISARRLAVASLSLFWLAFAAVAAEDPFAAVRADFMEAYTRAGAAGQNADKTDSEALRTYPLYPYLQSARIRRALLNTTGSLESVDQRAATFLTYYDREPVTRELRRAWLESLAERGQWVLFLQHYREASASDAMRCRSFTGRIALERTEGLAADIAAQWLTPQGLPECERAFEWLRAQNGLTPALVEQRVRLALTKGNTTFARQIIAQLPVQQSAALLQWAAILDNPQRGVDALIASPATPVDPAAMLAGWSQLARKDRGGAVARFDSLVRARQLDEKAASPYALAVALPLARDRDPDALTYFARVQPADLDDSALEWQVRAALWAGNWPLVSQSVAAMSDTARQTPRWRYWAARAAEQTHDATVAQQLYRSVIADDNYYSAMAAARLDQPMIPHTEKLVLDRAALREIGQLPAFVRSRELLRVNLRREALAEWQFGYDSLGEAVRPQTVHLAADWGWYDQAVATATQLRVFNDYALLYPQPYDREVRTAAKLTDVDPQLIYGVLRQESLYRADAVSPAGAYGLLQLLPATARSTAQRWERPRPSTSDLFSPSINVTLGAGQLRMLLDRFGGQTAVALAGYNAGPAAAARWLPTQAVDPDVWVENIPYNETRTYVQKVLWHSLVFAWLRSGGDAQRTEGWLARISSAPDETVLGTL
ncbi:MAG TPA: transglycosylase SLT domain-containing protein [Povalibacter sp.]|nr:transglycosylase SLT domain-containing protein [Povalibacter sp.]